MNDETETDILLALQATAGVLFARAATEIERLRKRVAELEAREQRPDPLSQALNEGDGVYRPLAVEQLRKALRGSE